MSVFDPVTETLRDADDVASKEVFAGTTSHGVRVRFVERALYSAVAAALVDTGCSADYARIMVEYGLQRSRLMAKRAVSLIVS